MVITAEQVIQVGGIVGPLISQFIQSHHAATGAFPTQEDIDAHVASRAQEVLATLDAIEARHPL